MDPNRLEYLSEQELEQLILEVEAQELLQAPSYLRRETMQKLQRKYDPIVPFQKKNKGTMAIYRIKVGMAVAAALIVLCILPEGSISGNTDERYPDLQEREWSYDPADDGGSSVAKQLRDTTDQICQSMQEISGWLVSWKF